MVVLPDPFGGMEARWNFTEFNSRTNPKVWTRGQKCELDSADDVRIGAARRIPLPLFLA